jgi:hypothetical protein
MVEYQGGKTMTVFQEIAVEVRNPNGKLAILSRDTHDYIMSLIEKAMHDAFTRGEKAGALKKETRG